MWLVLSTFFHLSSSVVAAESCCCCWPALGEKGEASSCPAAAAGDELRFIAGSTAEKGDRYSAGLYSGLVGLLLLLLLLLPPLLLLLPAVLLLVLLLLLLPCVRALALVTIQERKTPHCGVCGAARPVVWPAACKCIPELFNDLAPQALKMDC